MTNKSHALFSFQNLPWAIAWASSLGTSTQMAGYSRECTCRKARNQWRTMRTGRCEPMANNPLQESVNTPQTTIPYRKGEEGQGRGMRATAKPIGEGEACEPRARKGEEGRGRHCFDHCPDDGKLVLLPYSCRPVDQLTRMPNRTDYRETVCVQTGGNGRKMADPPGPPTGPVRFY